MRGLTLLLAATLTASYAYAASTAIVADRSESLARTAEAPAPATLPIWNGGTLPPVTVEALAPDGVSPGQPGRCEAPEAGTTTPAMPAAARLAPLRAS